MIIPWEQIPAETLHAMLEEIVTRDGTDYGSTEKTTLQKVTYARNQLEAGFAVLFWNSDIESASLVTAEEAGSLTRNQLEPVAD